MIMVDELRERVFIRGAYEEGTCRMTCDGDLEELHRFARDLGLKRQPPDTFEYELTRSKREQAIVLGASFVPRQLQQMMPAVRDGGLRAAVRAIVNQQKEPNGTRRAKR